VTPSPEPRIERFIARYAPPIAAQLRAARRVLRARFPRGRELVYDNYNALVFAYGPSERAGEIVLSIAGYPRWITLFFLHGTALPDPDGLLTGSGKQIRGVQLDSAADLRKPAIRALIAAALARAEATFAEATARQTVIKSVSSKQRTRRPKR
jgi:hypothetical protein